MLNRGKVDPYLIVPKVPEFTLVSNDITEGEPLPSFVFGAGSGGTDTSPHLAWLDAPAGTKSYAITCYDPDAPTGAGFWHWAVANIPATVTEVARGAGSPDSQLLPEGAITLPNELREPKFIGAGPPEGTGVHHYWFVVHALDVETLDVNPQQTPAVLGFMMRNHTLGRAILVATGEYGGAHPKAD